MKITYTPSEVASLKGTLASIVAYFKAQERSVQKRIDELREDHNSFWLKRAMLLVTGNHIDSTTLRYNSHELHWELQYIQSDIRSIKRIQEKIDIAVETKATSIILSDDEVSLIREATYG